jgi:hypothetical protein
MRSPSKLIPVAIFLAFGLCSFVAAAEEPNPTSGASQSESQQIDRDGKKICGWDVMNDSERAGYRNIMHKTNALEDRDAIRADHCSRMRAREKERGVPVEE